MKVFISGLFNRGKENEYVELEAAAKCSLEGLMKNGCSIMASKNDDKWLANFEALKAYIDEHHHLPPKSATDGKWMLNFAKYTRKKIKEGTLDDWKRELFEGLMAERWMDEHTGGRRKKIE